MEGDVGVRNETCEAAFKARQVAVKCKPWIVFRLPAACQPESSVPLASFLPPRRPPVYWASYITVTPGRPILRAWRGHPISRFSIRVVESQSADGGVAVGHASRTGSRRQHLPFSQLGVRNCA
jgi:hypothetical protein